MMNVLSIVYKLSVSTVIIENGEDLFWQFVVDCIENSDITLDIPNVGEINLEIQQAVLEFNHSLYPQLDVFQVERLIIALSHPTSELVSYASRQNRATKTLYHMSSSCQIKHNNVKSNMICEVYNPQKQLLNLYEQTRVHPLGALKERMKRVFTLCENDRDLFNSLRVENASELFWLYKHMGIDLSKKH